MPPPTSGSGFSCPGYTGEPDGRVPQACRILNNFTLVPGSPRSREWSVPETPASGVRPGPRCSLGSRDCAGPAHSPQYPSPIDLTSYLMKKQRCEPVGHPTPNKLGPQKFARALKTSCCRARNLAELPPRKPTAKCRSWREGPPRDQVLVDPWTCPGVFNGVS